MKYKKWIIRPFIVLIGICMIGISYGYWTEHNVIKGNATLVMQVDIEKEVTEDTIADKDSNKKEEDTVQPDKAADSQEDIESISNKKDSEIEKDIDTEDRTGTEKEDEANIKSEEGNVPDDTGSNKNESSDQDTSSKNITAAPIENAPAGSNATGEVDSQEVQSSDTIDNQ